MLQSLLLPLLLVSGPGQPAVKAVDDPPIRVWIDNNGRFLRGDRAEVRVRTEDDGYLIVLASDPEGNVRVLFPLDPSNDNFVRGGRKYEVEGRGGRDAFDVGDHSGRGVVYAAVSRAPYRFDDFVIGDHWDYRRLAPTRLSSDPEPELTELVRRMAQGDFDYDIETYYVVERVVHASDYYDDYYRPYYGGGYYYDRWGCGWSYYRCGSGISVGIFFGRPYYRRHYYGPFYHAYDPFYDPFFFDPYYYRPYYYRPVHYYPYPYYYNRGFYYDRGFYHPRWGRPYTPYRFRDRSLADADYRDRRFTFGRAVNTVYNPPIGRFSEPENFSPMRRAVDRRDTERPDATVGRRTTDRTKFTDRTETPRSGETRRGVEPRGTESPGMRRVGREHQIESTVPRTITARRARPAETSSPDPELASRGESRPVDVSPRRARVDRAPDPAPEGRSARRSGDTPRAESAPDPRSYGRADRGSDRGGRVERSPSRSGGTGWAGGGGGRRGGGGGSVSSGGGGRRR